MSSVVIEPCITDHYKGADPNNIYRYRVDVRVNIPNAEGVRIRKPFAEGTVAEGGRAVVTIFSKFNEVLRFKGVDDQEVVFPVWLFNGELDFTITVTKGRREMDRSGREYERQIGQESTTISFWRAT